MADAAFANRIWRDTLKYWDEEAKPRSIARHRELAAVDLPSLSDEAAADPTSTSAWITWRRCGSSTTRTTAPRWCAVGDFVLHAAGWTQRDPVPIFAVFDGWSPVSGVLNPEIAPAIEALRADPDAAALLTGDAPAAERLAKLREQVPAVDAYVRGVGFRIAAGFDLTNPTVVERPDLVLGRLAAAFGYDADHSTERADALAAELREAVPEDQRAALRRHARRGAPRVPVARRARSLQRLVRGRPDATRADRTRHADCSSVGRIGFKYDTLDLRGAEIDADPRRLARTRRPRSSRPGWRPGRPEQDRRPAAARAAASASAARRRPPAAPCSGDERARLRDRRSQRRGARACG